jgi:hypothetical protein
MNHISAGLFVKGVTGGIIGTQSRDYRDAKRRWKNDVIGNRVAGCGMARISQIVGRRRQWLEEF